jgi:nucleotide-binding universal stress UspA family protein
MTMVDTTAVRDAPGDAATRQLRVGAQCDAAQQRLRLFADRHFAGLDLVSCEVVDSGIDADPCADIVRTAARGDCDLIVLGTHGRSGLDHFLVGSVAEKVVRTSPIPTLVVRGTR